MKCFLYAGISDRYKDLLQDVQWLIPQIQSGISHRKQFELNLANVDTWLKKTEPELAESIRLDADATVIAMMVNKYEVRTSFVSNIHCKLHFCIIHGNEFYWLLFPLIVLLYS